MRALISLIMLAGFYIVALLQLAATVALAIWIGVNTNGLAAAKITFPLFAAIVGGAGVAMWKALRHKPGQPHGLVLTPEQAPYLWAEVRGLAEAVGTRAPDEIRIIPDVNAAVSEDTKLLGLLGGRRYLHLGMPLLQAFTLDQLRAVLAHELGHYSGRHTRLGAVAYRGRLAIAGTLARIGKWNVSGWIFKGYGRLYILADNAVSRRQEFEADAAAVRIAGQPAAISALTEVHVLGTAFGFYLNRYVAPGAEHGLLPRDMFAGFGKMVHARSEELADLREGTAEAYSEGSVWDTHPPLAERINAINALAASGHSADPRPAATLLSDLDSIGRRLQSEVVDGDGKQLLDWDELATARIVANLQNAADRMFREISRALGIGKVSLPMVLDLIADGRGADIAAPFFPDNTRKESVGLFSRQLDLLFTLAAVRSGKVRWLHSWTESPSLVDTVGNPIDMEEIAELATTPETLPEARKRLAELGIEIGHVEVVEAKATARGADIIAGMANIEVNNRSIDLLVLDKGLVLIPSGGGKDGGRKRMEQLLSIYTAQQLAARHPFVPYEEITRVEVEKAVPLRAVLHLHTGEVMLVKESWTGEELHGDSRKVLTAVFARIND